MLDGLLDSHFFLRLNRNVTFAIGNAKGFILIQGLLFRVNPLVQFYPENMNASSCFP